MRNFLKQNSIMILCALFVAVLAEGSTIVRPYGSSDYAGGAKAVGAKVNAEFENIATWLNGGNIGPTNISTSGVATSNIASFAVTLAKLDSASIKITASSSAYSMGSTTPAVVTNLSTTITTTGRPITVSLENAPASYLYGGSQKYGGYVATGGMTTGGSSSNDGHHIFFVRDSSTTAFFNLYGDAGGVGTQTYPCSQFRYTEQPAAGTYTFSLQASTQNSGGSNAVVVNNCRLVVREW